MQKTIADTDIASLGYQGVKITHADWGFPGYGPTVILVSVSPEVLAFQGRLVDAVSPFVDAGGTAAAFVADPGETIIDWVEAYVPNQIGDGKYLPHITVGVARFDDLKVIGTAPVCAFKGVTLSAKRDPTRGGLSPAGFMAARDR